MSTRQELAVLGIGLWLAGAAVAESPQEAAGKAMAASLARQVAFRRDRHAGVDRQAGRAAVTMASPERRDPRRG